MIKPDALERMGEIVSCIENEGLRICNMNQVQASFLKEYKLDGDIMKTNVLFDEFINGHQRNLSKDDKAFIENLDENDTFLKRSWQPCKNMFIHMSFRGFSSTWKHLSYPRIMLFSCLLLSFSRLHPAFCWPSFRFYLTFFSI